MSDLHLSLPEIQIIDALLSKSPMRWSELAERLKMSTRTLRKALRKLEKAGYVERKVDVDAGYPPPVYYSLTDKAKEECSFELKMIFLCYSVIPRFCSLESLNSLSKSISEQINLMMRRYIASQLFVVMKTAEKYQYVSTGDSKYFLDPTFMDVFLPIFETHGLLKIKRSKYGETILFGPETVSFIRKLLEEFFPEELKILEEAYRNIESRIETLFSR